MARPKSNQTSANISKTVRYNIES